MLWLNPLIAFYRLSNMLMCTFSMFINTFCWKQLNIQVDKNKDCWLSYFALFMMPESVEKVLLDAVRWFDIHFLNAVTFLESKWLVLGCLKTGLRGRHQLLFQLCFSEINTIVVKMLASLVINNEFCLTSRIPFSL